MTVELISVHFPKAAGTSLGAMLRCYFGSDLFTDYDHDPVNPNHDLNESPRLPPGTRAVHGHFRGDRYQYFRSAHHITFLREPVDNLISIYYFWRTTAAHGNAAHDRFLVERPTIFEFAQYGPCRQLMSDSYFGRLDLNVFDFIGFYEFRTEDLTTLSNMLGVPVDPDMYLNRSSDTEVEERSALKACVKSIETLRGLLLNDITFYERALQRRSLRGRCRSAVRAQT
jgi:hypothetical protein